MDAYIVDGLGRRLGFSQWYGGKLTEASLAEAIDLYNSRVATPACIP